MLDTGTNEWAVNAFLSVHGRIINDEQTKNPSKIAFRLSSLNNHRNMDKIGMAKSATGLTRQLNPINIPTTLR